MTGFSGQLLHKYFLAVRAPRHQALDGWSDRPLYRAQVGRDPFLGGQLLANGIGIAAMPGKPLAQPAVMTVELARPLWLLVGHEDAEIFRNCLVWAWETDGATPLAQHPPEAQFLIRLY